MVRIFVRHKVSDFASWKKGYDAAEPIRQRFGCSDAAIFQVPGDPTDVIVTHDFPDAASAHGFMDVPELRSAMEAAGVVSEPEVWFGQPALG